MGLFNRKKRSPQQTINTGLPILGGRQTAEEDVSIGNRFNRGIQSYGTLSYNLPFELYDYVELVATYNADFSQAVDNVKNLANPGFNILVNAKDAGKSKAFRGRLASKELEIKSTFGGFHGIVNSLVRQGAIYGAMCGEWVLSADLKDVIDFVLVNPKNIRFFWDEEKQVWQPYQKVSIDQIELARKRGQKIVNMDCIELNSNTFLYYTVYTSNNNPYGIPPFIAALEPISIQRELTDNFKSIAKKMGMLGILEVVIERFPMEPEETVAEYTSRCQSFLTNYKGVIQDMTKEGGLVHFDDTTVTNLSISEKAEGAEKLFALNEEQVFSGLHSLPSVQGRSYSSTETYAGVSYEILLRSMGDFTKGAKYIIEQGLWLMDRVWGIGVEEIKLDFSENKALNQLQKAQAEAISISNNEELWRQGVIDQNEFAQRHNSPAPAKPLEDPVERGSLSERPNLQPQRVPTGEERLEDSNG